MTDTRKKREPKPPYIGLSDLEKLIDHLSTRSLKTIGVDELIMGKGFKKSVAYQSLGALRFLGLISEDGAVTEAGRSLRLEGDKREEELKEIVRTAYKVIFSRIDDPYSDSVSKDDLLNDFLVGYNLSKRLAESAVPAFLWLSAKAGLVSDDKIKPVAKPHRVSKGLGRQHGKTSEDPGLKENFASEFNEYPFGGGKVLLLVSKGLISNVILSEEFRLAYLAIEKLVCSVEPGVDKETEDGGDTV